MQARRQELDWDFEGWMANQAVDAERAVELAALVEAAEGEARRELRPERREGRIFTVPFRSRGDDPHDVARRAIAYAAGSAGPNTYAIGGSERRDLRVAPQLVPLDDVTPAEVVREPGTPS